jgi:hypothetical protein
MILHCKTSKYKQGSVKKFAKKQAKKIFVMSVKNTEKWG